jgi:glycosyltransferase involved in cell wall biosynthesis
LPQLVEKRPLAYKRQHSHLEARPKAGDQQRPLPFGPTDDQLGANEENARDSQRRTQQWAHGLYGSYAALLPICVGSTLGEADSETVPRFSVVIPAFDAAATIRSAVSSVLRQTAADFELIIVDDGSTDETPSILAELAAADRRIIVHSKPNAGVSAALNDGLGRASADYVSMLGADDLWLSTYLEVMGAALDDGPTLGFAYAAAWWISSDPVPRVQRHDVMTRNLPPGGPPSTPRLLVEQLLVRGNFIPASALMRREAVESVGKFDERLRVGEDYELWLRLAAHGHGATYVAAKQWIKRVRQDALSWDPRATTRAWRDICNIVEAEYDVPENVRALARARAMSCSRELDELSRAPRRGILARIRAVAGRLKRRLFWWRWYYVRPPRELRERFPDLREI